MKIVLMVLNTLLVFCLLNLTNQTKTPDTSFEFNSHSLNCINFVWLSGLNYCIIKFITCRVLRCVGE